jgi:DNA modification methylase
MITILQGDALEQLCTLSDESVQCCITSPPYWGLRDYGINGQIGLEDTPEAYVWKIVEVFREVRRVLKKDGTLWVNLGDSYAAGGHGGGGSFMDMRGENGSQSWAHRSDKKGWRSPPPGLKPKDLCGIPWRIAFALQADGWYLRSDIIWHKPNPMPESVTDRPTKAHEYLFLLSKNERYFYDADAIRENGEGYGRCNWNAEQYKNGDITRHHGGKESHARGGGSATYEGGRNKRSVWTIATAPYSEAHFATFPPDLIKPCILAGSRPHDTILDPFAGSGTTGMVAIEFGRKALLIELNSAYIPLIERRCSITPGFAWV